MRFGRVQEGRTYEVTCGLDADRLTRLQQLFRDCGLEVKDHKLVKSCEGLVCILEAFGSLEDHERLVKALLADSEVREFRY